MTFHGLVSGGLFVLSLIGCGRADLLYYIGDKPVQNYEKVHPLKQLLGQSKVDILWVVDNSGSMGIHQDNLAKNADLFMSQFVAKGGLQWKMGVVSTAVLEPPYVGMTAATPLNFHMKDSVEVFRKTIRRLGTNGNADEKSFSPVLRHLKESPDFLRPEATLAVIFVTDAPEQSNIPASTYLNELKKFKGGAGSKIVNYGVLTPNHFGCPGGGEMAWNYKGSPFEEAIDGTKGKLYKLCGDFGKNLSDLAKDLVTRVDNPFITLEERPQTESIRVVYKGKDLPGGPVSDGGYWIYDFDRNRVVFHNLEFAPGDKEEVTIVYSN